MPTPPTLNHTPHASRARDVREASFKIHALEARQFLARVALDTAPSGAGWQVVFLNSPLANFDVDGILHP